MTGTGDLIGGDTLAGGGAAEAGDMMLGLLLGAPLAGPARRDSVSGNSRCEAPAALAPPTAPPTARTCLVDDNDLFIIQARSIALAPLALQGLWSRRACAGRLSSDGCMQA